MLNYDDVIEKMARAYCVYKGMNPDKPLTGYISKFYWQYFQPEARAMLQALQDALPSGLTLEEELCGKDLKGEDTILGGEIYDDRAELYQQLKQLGRE